jgi:porin
VYWSFRDAFLIAELKRGWNRQKTDTGLPGQTKLGGWYHTGEFAHQRLDNSGQSLADPASSGQPFQVRGNWGAYLTAEQQLWREGSDNAPSDQGLGVFTRIGGSPGDRNPLEFYVEGGLTYTGLVPGRKADVCGVAVVYGHMSRDARQLAAECNDASPAPGPLPDYEMVVEATYRAALRPGLTVQPVVASVIHPGGSAGGDAVVLAFRFNLDF